MDVQFMLQKVKLHGGVLSVVGEDLSFEGDKTITENQEILAFLRANKQAVIDALLSASPRVTLGPAEHVGSCRGCDFAFILHLAEWPHERAWCGHADIGQWEVESCPLKKWFLLKNALPGVTPDSVPLAKGDCKNCPASAPRPQDHNTLYCYGEAYFRGVAAKPVPCATAPKTCLCGDHTQQRRGN